MVDEEDKYFDEDEDDFEENNSDYYLSEDSEVETETPTSEASAKNKLSSSLSPLKEKLAELTASGTVLGGLWEKIRGYWLFLVIGFVFIIFALYQFAGLFTSNVNNTTIKPVSTKIIPSKTTSQTFSFDKKAESVSEQRKTVLDKLTTTQKPAAPKKDVSPQITTAQTPAQPMQKAAEIVEKTTKTSQKSSKFEKLLQKEAVIPTKQQMTKEKQLVKSTVTIATPLAESKSLVQKSTKSGIISDSKKVRETRVALQLQQEINSLKKTTTVTNIKITKIEKQMSDIQQMLGALSRSITKLSKAQPQPQMVAQPKKHIKKMMTEYQLRAVIPGRAWVSTPSGQQTSVNTGEYLKDYGKITRIDAAKGVVYTSSGKTITFMSN